MSRTSDVENKIKAFAMSNSMAMESLSQIQEDLGIDLGLTDEESNKIKQNYFPQFSSNVRAEARRMRDHYELFYCLEKTIRQLVTDSLETAEGATSWWDSNRVQDQVKSDVKNRIQKEVDSGMTIRSEAELDYTTFGELGQIITGNWDVFGGLFTSKKAVEKVMASLNMLRGPIAHCSVLAEDEILRLNLTVRDWFRLME